MITFFFVAVWMCVVVTLIVLEVFLLRKRHVDMMRWQDWTIFEIIVLVMALDAAAAYYAVMWFSSRTLFFYALYGCLSVYATGSARRMVIVGGTGLTLAFVAKATFDIQLSNPRIIDVTIVAAVSLILLLVGTSVYVQLSNARRRYPPFG